MKYLCILVMRFKVKLWIFARGISVMWNNGQINYVKESIAKLTKFKPNKLRNKD